MRLAHVVPCLGPTGEFGGPVSVAVGQCQELARRGHSVTLAGGWLGQHKPPQHVEGVPTALFRVVKTIPRNGFSGMISPGLTSWLFRNRTYLDLLHLHTGRHLGVITLPRIRGHLPYVIQTHGMVPPAATLGLRLFDFMLTTPSLHSAAAVFSLTNREDQDLRSLPGGAALRICRLPNGIQAPTALPSRPPLRDPVEILFLSRLHARKRPVELVSALAILVKSLEDNIRLTFVGPDDGEGTRVLGEADRLGVADLVRLEPAIAHQDVANRIGQSDIFVLPSVDEPFPMVVLEAMAAGTPVVVTTECGVAQLLKQREAGGVVDPTPAGVAHELARLIHNEQLRDLRARNAFRTLTELLSVAAVVDGLEQVYGGIRR